MSDDSPASSRQRSVTLEGASSRVLDMIRKRGGEGVRGSEGATTTLASPPLLPGQVSQRTSFSAADSSETSRSPSPPGLTRKSSSEALKALLGKVKSVRSPSAEPDNKQALISRKISQDHFDVNTESLSGRDSPSSPNNKLTLARSKASTPSSEEHTPLKFDAKTEVSTSISSSAVPHVPVRNMSLGNPSLLLGDILSPIYSEIERASMDRGGTSRHTSGFESDTSASSKQSGDRSVDHDHRLRLTEDVVLRLSSSGTASPPQTTPTVLDLPLRVSVNRTTLSPDRLLNMRAPSVSVTNATDPYIGNIARRRGTRVRSKIDMQAVRTISTVDGGIGSPSTLSWEEAIQQPQSGCDSFSEKDGNNPPEFGMTLSVRPAPTVELIDGPLDKFEQIIVDMFLRINSSRSYKRPSLGFEKKLARSTTNVRGNASPKKTLVNPEVESPPKKLLPLNPFRTKVVASYGMVLAQVDSDFAWSISHDVSSHASTARELLTDEGEEPLRAAIESLLQRRRDGLRYVEMYNAKRKNSNDTRLFVAIVATADVWNKETEKSSLRRVTVLSADRSTDLSTLAAYRQRHSEDREWLASERRAFAARKKAAESGAPPNPPHGSRMKLSSPPRLRSVSEFPNESLASLDDGDITQPTEGTFNENGSDDPSAILDSKFPSIFKPPNLDIPNSVFERLAIDELSRCKVATSPRIDSPGMASPTSYQSQNKLRNSTMLPSKDNRTTSVKLTA